jgi:arylsulfatase A-like enzyme
MYPGVMWLPLLAQLPQRSNTPGQRRHELVYNHDLVATVYDLAGTDPEQQIHGQSLMPLLTNRDGWTARQYVTCRYANSLCYIDDHTWALGNIDGHAEQVFDLDADPQCTRDIAASDNGKRWKTAWDRILHDADGELPDYRTTDFSDALGRRLP